MSRSLTFRLETKMPWCQTPSRKKRGFAVFTTVTTSACQDQLNAGYSKVCEIFKVCGIESLKYVQEFYSLLLCFTCQSYGLLGGPWPFKAAKVPRSSAVFLKVWLRETSACVTCVQSMRGYKNCVLHVLFW